MISLGSKWYIKGGAGRNRIGEVVEILSDKRVRLRVLPAWQWDNMMAVGTEVNKLVTSLMKPLRNGQNVMYGGDIYTVKTQNENNPFVDLILLGRRWSSYYGKTPLDVRVINLEDVSLYK